MIYLDNAATSFPKPPQTIKAVVRQLSEVGASPGRGQYRAAMEAGRTVAQTRKTMARLLGVGNPADIFFTANATEALNLAIKGWVRPGDTVVTTSTEHNAVYRPLARLAETQGVKVRRAPNDETGAVDLKVLGGLIRNGARLVVAAHASNVIGAILPVADISEICAGAKVPFLLDAAQSAGCLPLDIESLGVDMVAFTGHKALLGPQGTGGLYVSPKLEICELKQGGTGGMSKSDQPKFRPDRYESGTMNTPGLAGLGAGARFTLEQGVDKIHGAESEKINELMARAQAVEGVSLFGPPLGATRAPLVSLTMAGVTPHQLALLLDKRFDIAARAGLHCAPEAHRVIGTLSSGTLRLSPGFFNTDEDIKTAANALEAIKRELA